MQTLPGASPLNTHARAHPASAPPRGPEMAAGAAGGPRGCGGGRHGGGAAGYARPRLRLAPPGCRARREAEGGR